MLMLCKTKGIWSHAENNIMHKCDVLTMKNIYDEPAFLNKQIGPTRWIPVGYDHDMADHISNQIQEAIRYEDA